MRLQRFLYLAINFVFLLLTFISGYAQQSMDETTMPQMPVMAASNEATGEQLDCAKAEGDSVNQCIQWLLHQSGVVSGQTAAGEYKITYVFSKPEGWYQFSNEELSWHQPSENADAHLWLFVQDGSDNRIVPPLTIKYTLTNGQGNVTDANNISYAWMPLINGYGNNVKLSGDGTYTLNIEILPMPYRRHDPYNGDRFANKTVATVTASINPTQLNTQPLSEAMEANQNISAGIGKAFHNTLQEMYKQANDGRDTTSGDYKVAYAVEYAEGYWHFEKDKFRYMMENDMSGKTNAHVEIAVLDKQTGRFLPNLAVKATLQTPDGKTIGTMAEPFMWHPWLYHYGENWRIPHAGSYTIVANIQPPAYRRYGKTLGKQFEKPVTIAFHNAIIKAGQK